LFATPIPAEYESQGAAIQQAVEQAIRESIELGVDKKGKEVTPWLLKRVGELTKGKALESSECRGYRSFYGDIERSISLGKS
jgi:pseudouridine-5'-phosphate glycosidase/pseudouridine kinase